MSKLSVLFLILFVGFSINIYSQDNSWEAELKFGNSLVWGDAASTKNVFNRFISKESRPSFGLDLQKKLNKTLGLYGSFNMGWTYGERAQWTSASYHPVITSNGVFFDYHLGVKVDFTSMFGFKSDRLLSAYGFGGVGMVNYDAKSFADGVLHNQVRDNTIIVPWGLGVKFKLNNNLNLLFENSFRHTFVDDFDAYEGSGTDVNDIYSLTSIGLSYTFNIKFKKDEELDIIEEEPEDLIAESKPKVRHSSNFPDSLSADSTYHITVIIAKDSIQGPLKYTLTYPKHCDVDNVKSKDAIIKKSENNLILEWDKVPSDNIAINYTLATSDTVDSKNNVIVSTRFEYLSNDEHKMDFFNKRISFTQKQEVVLPQEETLEEEQNDTIYEDKIEIIYRVQIAALFKSQSTPQKIRDYFDLDEEVYEFKYKNSYRYMVGSFDTYGEALQHPVLKRIEGSYVVVFVNGKYHLYLYEINDLIKDKDGILSDKTTYKVQIAASKGRPYSIAKLAYKYGVKPYDITENVLSEWYQYSVGTFDNIESAKVFLAEIRKINPQAYIVEF